MKAILTSLAALSLLAGCAMTSSNEASSGSSDAVTSGPAGAEALCTPPPTLYRLTKPNPAYYQVFGSDEEAAAAVKPVLDAIGKHVSATPAPANAVAIVAKAFAAYQKLYPEHTAGMDAPPRVLLLDDPSPNAFAMIDPSQDHVYPWVFYIQTGLLSAPEVTSTPGVLESTIAHELGHLILKNLFGRDAYTFYALKGGEAAQYGFLQKQDPAVKEEYQAFQDAATRMGKFYDRAFGSYPFHVSTLPEPTFTGYLKLIAQAMAAAGTTPPTDCAAADDAQGKLQALLEKHLDKSDLTLPLGDDDAAVAMLSASWENSTRACLSSVHGSLADLIASGRQELTNEGGTPADLDNLIPALAAADTAVDQASTADATIDHFFEVAKARRAAMAKIVEDPSFTSLRFFSEEEEADDASVRVAMITGAKVDMIMTPYAPTFRSDCTALLASGGAPEYGGFVDAHHGLCWRYQHVTSLAKDMAAVCGRADR